METAVSVIVVGFNGERVIPDCLDSLLAQSLRDYEIIAVDNGSSDRTADLIRARTGERVRLLENRENLGFAAANNIGYRVSGGRYIALLNQDARAEPTWLEELVRTAESHPGAGMIASLVLRPGSPAVIDSAGLAVYPDGLNRTRGGGEPDQGQYGTVEEVFAPSGSAAFYRREMIEQTGFYDPDTFLYGDDIDLGFRGRLKGWTCFYAPTAVAHHPLPGRPEIDPREKSFHVEKNRMRVALKYLPLPRLLEANLFASPARYSLQALSYFRGRGPAARFRESGGELFDLVRITARAHFSTFQDLPRLLRERKQWSREKTVTVEEINSWFRRFGISARSIAFQE